MVNFIYCTYNNLKHYMTEKRNDYNSPYRTWMDVNEKTASHETVLDVIHKCLLLTKVTEES